MAKKQQKFRVAITIPEEYRDNGRLRCRPAAELLIYGLAYEVEDEDGLKSYEYDIDEIHYKDYKDGEFRPIALSFLEAIAGVTSIKELPHFHEPCMMQAAASFEKAIDQPKNVAA